MKNRVLPGLMLVFVAGCANNEIEAVASPQSAAEAFLLLIDQGDYQTSWQEASAFLQSNVDADQWAEHAGSYRRPLGVVDERSVASIEYQDSLEDMPDGSYAFVLFNSSLADDRQASELVGLVQGEDSVWRVIGYQTQ